MEPISRKQVIERLRAVDLGGGSHESLSAIAKAVYWTIVACEALRQTLVRLLGGDTAQGKRVTDELRHEVANYPFRDNRDFALFEDIADRIDAEHEEAIQQALMGEGSVPATDENMAKHGWVRLPKDADGEYINIFDRVEHTNGTFTVNDMTLGIDGMWRARDFENGYTVLLAKCRHCQAPTVEDVLLDMHRRLSDVSELYDVDSDELEDEYTRIIEEFAAKLRLAGDEKEQ